MRRAMQLGLALAVLLGACAAAAQRPIVYPARGQSAQKQGQDESQCAAWAKQSTGIDPAMASLSGPATDGAGGRWRPTCGRGGTWGGGWGGAWSDGGERGQGRRGRGGGGHHGWWPWRPPAAGGPESALPGATAAPDPDVLSRSAACLEGRGYTIK